MVTGTREGQELSRALRKSPRGFRASPNGTHLKEKFSAFLPRQGRIHMDTPSVERGMQAHAAVLETAALAQWDFTQEEMASLLWLREWYQHGGSDRMEVVRHLEFLKFLVTHGKLPS